MEFDFVEYRWRSQLRGHSDDFCVGPLAWVSLQEEFPEGGVVSGGMDTHALVWHLAIGEKVQSLKDHQVQVTGIALDGLDVATSSVDSYEFDVDIGERLPLPAIAPMKALEALLIVQCSSKKEGQDLQ